MSVSVYLIEDLPPQKREVQISEEELQRLVKDIKDRGLAWPILVTESGVVLDGLRRIEAYKKMRIKQIPAVVSDELGTLGIAYQDKPRGEIRMDRVVEILEDVKDIHVRWNKKRRILAASTAGVGSAPGAGVATRVLLSYLTGLSEGRVEILLMANRLAEIDTEVKERVDMVRNGYESVYGLRTWLDKRKHPEPVNDTPPAEVWGTMERALRTIGMAIEQMAQFGSATMLTRAQREWISADLGKHRSAMARQRTALVNGVDDERSKESNE